MIGLSLVRKARHVSLDGGIKVKTLLVKEQCRRCGSYVVSKCFQSGILFLESREHTAPGQQHQILRPIQSCQRLLLPTRHSRRVADLVVDGRVRISDETVVVYFKSGLPREFNLFGIFRSNDGRLFLRLLNCGVIALSEPSLDCTGGCKTDPQNEKDISTSRHTRSVYRTR